MNIRDILKIEFEKPQIETWKNLASTQLKTESINEKLQFLNLEGLNIEGLNLEAKTNFELKTFPKNCESQVYVLEKFEIDKIQELAKSLDVDKLYRGDANINSSHLHNSGATVVHELSYILENVRDHLLKEKKDLKIEVSLDSLSFVSIAKLRALRFMLDTFYEQNSIKQKFQLIVTQSLREQSIFDPWMNMLRATSIATSALIGGADVIALTSYDFVFAKINKATPNLLGLRNVINMFKVLVEESSLKKVQDPAAGSYAIENITYDIISKVESQLKENELKNDLEAYYSQAAKTNYEKRILKLNTRRLVMSGVNNFINLYEDLVDLYNKSHIDVKWNSRSKFPLRRLAQGFESLRLEMSLKQFKVKLLCIGSESELSGRINFCQNYFETAGIEVSKKFVSFSELSSYTDSFICICSTDEQIEQNKESIETLAKKQKVFVSGKIECKGSQSLFMGQNVFDVLSKFEEMV